MATFNKIKVAAEMFIEAHIRYTAATRDIDYITSIMLSGAVIGIIGPLLAEQGGHPTHSLLARFANAISETNEPKYLDGMFRTVYNGFKHAGNKNKVIKPSDDLKIQANITLEAARMLDAAKQDFYNITISHDLKNELSAEFFALLNSEKDYE